MAFLTLEDPNAKVKGYRDPLSAQPIWAKFGRHLVTNLTTQTTSVRGFTILLLGRYFAQQLFESGAIQSEDALDVFLRMEQVGAYVRHAAHGVEGGIRGIERVKRNLAEGGKVAIGSNSQCMILSDQKVYGLWGLYSVSARESGLIPEGPLGVEPDAAEFIESHYVHYVEPARTRVDRLLSQGGKLDAANRDAVFSAFEPILSEELTPNELDFYGKYLADAVKADDRSNHRQQRFRSLLDDQVGPDDQIGRAALTKIYEASKTNHEDIADKTDRIITLESVLAPTDVLFQHVLTKNSQDPAVVAAEVRNRWGSSVPNIDPARTADLLAEQRPLSARKRTSIFSSIQ